MKIEGVCKCSLHPNLGMKPGSRKPFNIHLNFKHMTLADGQKSLCRSGKASHMATSKKRYIEHAWFATIPVGFIWSYLFGAYFQCWAHQNSLFLVFPNIDRPLWIPSRNHTSVSWWFYFFDLRPPIPIPLHNIIIYLRQNQTWQWNIWTSMNIPLSLPSKNAQKTIYIRFPTRSLWLRQNRHPPTAGCPRKCCQLEIGLNRDFYLEINWEPKRKSDVE